MFYFISDNILFLRSILTEFNVASPVLAFLGGDRPQYLTGTGNLPFIPLLFYESPTLVPVFAN